VAVAEQTATGRVIAAWPSFALIASHELLMRQVRRATDADASPQQSRQSRSRPERASSAGPLLSGPVPLDAWPGAAGKLRRWLGSGHSSIGTVTARCPPAGTSGALAETKLVIIGAEPTPPGERAARPARPAAAPRHTRAGAGRQPVPAPRPPPQLPPAAAGSQGRPHRRRLALRVLCRSQSRDRRIRIAAASGSSFSGRVPITWLCGCEPHPTAELKVAEAGAMIRQPSTSGVTKPVSYASTTAWTRSRKFSFVRIRLT